MGSETPSPLNKRASTAGSSDNTTEDEEMAPGTFIEMAQEATITPSLTVEPGHIDDIAAYEAALVAGAISPIPPTRDDAVGDRPGWKTATGQTVMLDVAPVEDEHNV